MNVVDSPQVEKDVNRSTRQQNINSSQDQQ